MNKYYWFLLVAVVAGFSFLLGQRNGNLRLAYVNSAVLVESYEGTKLAREKLNAESNILAMRLDTLRMEFEEIQKIYMEEESTMSKKEKELQIELLRTKGSQVEGYQNMMIDKVRERESKVMSEIRNHIDSKIKSYAQERGYVLILGANGTGNVVYGDQSIDITQELVQLVNS